jgi:hypothetical protein
MMATSAISLRPKFFSLDRQSTALIVGEPHSSPAQLLAQNSVLLAEVVNHLQLALVHPPGDGD